MKDYYGPIDRPEYIGLKEIEAIDKSTKEGMMYIHILVRDGIDFPMSSSLCYSRISFNVENGIVKKATQG